MLLHLSMASSMSKVLPNRTSRLYHETCRSIKYLMCQYGPDRGADDIERL